MRFSRYYNLKYHGIAITCLKYVIFKCLHPEPCEAFFFIMDRCALLDLFWTIEKFHPFTAIIKIGRARMF